ncbi:hypothetical protein Lser_V15G15286 [Lactuca serriola]
MGVSLTFASSQPLVLSERSLQLQKNGGLMVLRGTMRAHIDWVTTIDNSDMVVTSSRDKSIIVWRLTKEDKTYGVAQRHLTGHSHFVQDVVLSSDYQFALSGSWDDELCLWDLNVGTTARRFVGHTKDFLSVAFSIDNLQIVSASHDKSIKLWNTLGECKYTIQDGDAHSDWMKRTKPRVIGTKMVEVRRSSRVAHLSASIYKELVVYERVELPRTKLEAFRASVKTSIIRQLEAYRAAFNQSISLKRYYVESMWSFILKPITVKQRVLGEDLDGLDMNDLTILEQQI